MSSAVAFGRQHLLGRRQAAVRFVPPACGLLVALIGSVPGTRRRRRYRPRTPVCGYGRHFRAQLGDQRPVVFAHVAGEEGKGLALQDWFWYDFDDFNDKHEGDWEMIQLLFTAETVEQALSQEPTEVAFAQHKGGETADWEEPTFERADGRPVSYPSRGSHASSYGPGVWLGSGWRGTGLGSDVTTGPSNRIESEVRLVPDDIAHPSHPFPWATVLYARLKAAPQPER